MDSATERHNVLSEQAQKVAEEKVQFNAEVREHISGIMRCFGVSLYETVKTATYNGNPQLKVDMQTDLLVQGWENLAKKICDFTEFLDEN